VHKGTAGFAAGRHFAGSVAGRAGRFLVVALHVPFSPTEEGATVAGGDSGDGPGDQCGVAVAMDSGGGREKRGGPARDRAAVFCLAAGGR